MFGLRRRREAAAAEAARETERRALFAQLAQRPAHVCPFLGLAYERTGYVDGPSIEHRCFAFGDPVPLSSEQQTRVCQERGYGQCPRYLRGLLVTPPDDLEVLRNPRAAAAAAAAAPEPTTPPQRRRRGPARPLRLVVLVLAVLLLVAGAGYLALTGGLDLGFVGLGPDATPSPTADPGAVPSGLGSPSQRATASPAAASPDEPRPSAAEATPAPGDSFAFYEVFVEAGEYLVFQVSDAGEVVGQGTASFEEASFARVEPIEAADGGVYWRTEEGGLEGFAYRSPQSGDFAIRAVFLDESGARRSVFLEEEDLARFPQATPAP